MQIFFVGVYWLNFFQAAKNITSALENITPTPAAGNIVSAQAQNRQSPHVKRAKWHLG